MKGGNLYESESDEGDGFVGDGFGVLGLGAHAAPAPAYTLDLDQGKGKIEFRAIGRPSGLKVVGTGEAAKGKIEMAGNKASGVAVFNLESLVTGIEMRDEHMKKRYLETGKFPEAKLSISRIDCRPTLCAATSSSTRSLLRER